MGATRTAGAWERYAWAAGIVFVVAVVAESALSFAFGVDQNDSAAKIAKALDDHRRRLVLITGLCVVYAAAFPIYLSNLYALLRGYGDRALAALVLLGGLLMIALHAVSDVGIYGLLAGKLASYGVQHDPGLSYTLYLLTYAVDSVGDVFGSLFMFATGVLVLRSRLMPRWLGWVAILVGILFFAQGFGLGGVVATFGLVVDGIGFVLFLVFVLVSSVILLARRTEDAPQV